MRMCLGWFQIRTQVKNYWLRSNLLNKAPVPTRSWCLGDDVIVSIVHFPGRKG
jgi:hypothetical protein